MTPGSGYEPFSSNGARCGTAASVKQYPGDYTQSSSRSANGRQTVYHLFDQAAGIDLGTLPCPN